MHKPPNNLAHLREELRPASLRLRIYDAVLLRLLKVMYLLVFGRGPQHHISAIKEDLFAVAAEVEARRYKRAVVRLLRLEPIKAYNLIESLILWRLRPRLGLAALGMLSTLLTVGLLFQQNRIVERQNELTERQNRIMAQQSDISEKQTKATELQAISSLVSSLDPERADKNEIAIAQLSVYGVSSTDVLIRLAERPGGVAFSAAIALLGQSQAHNPEQAARVLDAVTRPLEMAVEARAAISSDRASVTLEGARSDIQIAPYTMEYFAGLTRRCQDQEFRSRLQKAMRADSRFLNGIAYLYYLFFVFNRDLVSPDIKDSVPAELPNRLQLKWHEAFYAFCRAVVGSPQTEGEANARWLELSNRMRTIAADNREARRVREVRFHIERWLELNTGSNSISEGK